MSAAIQGTFTNLGHPSHVMAENLGAFALTTLGLDGSNTIKSQRSTTNGAVWIDVTTYNSEQTGTVITPAAGEQYRLVGVTQQANKDIKYKMSREN